MLSPLSSSFALPSIFIAAATTLLQLLSPPMGATALPTGAPRCIINQTAIAGGHGAQTTTLGFAVSAPATYTPGSTTALSITVSGLSTFTSGGILTYVNSTTLTNTSYAQEHVGSFDIATNGLRAQYTSVCNGVNVFNEGNTSTVTHASPIANTDIATLMWTPPATDFGTVQVNVVVATGSSGNPWMILASTTIASSGSTSSASTSSSAATAAATTTATTSTAAATTTATTSTSAATTTATTAATTTTTAANAAATWTVNAGATKTATLYVNSDQALVLMLENGAAAASATTTSKTKTKTTAATATTTTAATATATTTTAAAATTSSTTTAVAATSAVVASTATTSTTAAAAAAVTSVVTVTVQSTSYVTVT
ncbi:hypothetical protein HK405_007287, partial [Cladochytrium tenue]